MAVGGGKGEEYGGDNASFFIPRALLNPDF